MLYVVKRDGREVLFNPDKVFNAIKKASEETAMKIDNDQILKLTDSIVDKIKEQNIKKVSVEQIQDFVQKILIENGYTQVGTAYAYYRKERTRIRDLKSELMNVISGIGVETDRDNANVGNNFSSKLLRIASESNKWHNLATMPKKLAKAHENGDIYFHDLDSYNLTINCLHIPTAKMLKNGFNTGYGYIRPPKRIESAAELSCILMQASQNDMFGGQSHPNFDNDMADFVEPTRKEIIEEFESIGVDKKTIDKAVSSKLEKSIRQSMQGIIYNLNTMHSRAGSQVPFSSVNIGIPKNDDAALICKLFLEEYEKGLGKGEQPIFPNIIFRVKKGVNKEVSDKYFYLYKLACRVASKRMNPTFMNIDADFNKKYYDMGIIPATMGCRTYICSNVNGKPGVEGRGNIAPTTINLPRIGILAQKSVDKFFKLFDNRIDLAKESLLERYNVLKHLRVKDLPFVVGQQLMQGSENLEENDSIEPVLKQGTYAIGFIGLAEALVALTGHHHGETEEARKIGYDIIKHLRDKVDQFTEETHLNWSCYATPAEGLSGKFIVKDKNIFGIMPGVTDKDYYTNSYHIPVGFNISIKDKIDIEAPYHALCNGGHITYIELDDYPSAETVQDIISYAYDNTNISYMGINFHIRYCKQCGTYLSAGRCTCPKCGSHDIQGISRVTGYLSLDERFGEGTAAERADRITQGTSNHMYDDVKLSGRK